MSAWKISGISGGPFSARIFAGISRPAYGRDDLSFRPDNSKPDVRRRLRTFQRSVRAYAVCQPIAAGHWSHPALWASWTNIAQKICAIFFGRFWLTENLNVYLSDYLGENHSSVSVTSIDLSHRLQKARSINRLLLVTREPTYLTG